MTSPDDGASPSKPGRECHPNQVPKLLLVDDVPTNIQLLAEVLGADYELYFASNGPQALEIASHEDPDLVLLDVVMPGMDGFEVRQAMNEVPALKAIPVIFITASDDKDDEARGLGLGGVDYITKPFNPALVALRVRNQIELKRQRDELATQTAALQRALRDVKTLSGLLPMCAWCRKLKDDQGRWVRIETYLAERSDARVSHGICPECRTKLAAEDST
jgi:PleD family two-component response regulator